MKKILVFVVVYLSALISTMSQSGVYRLNFNSNDWAASYSHPDFTLSNNDGILRIVARSAGTDWQNITGLIPETDLSSRPFVLLKIRVQEQARFQIRLIDNRGKETNDNNPIADLLPHADFQWISFDFSNKFVQNWPASDSVKSKAINKFSIILNGGGNPDYTGWIEIDEIIFGDTNAVVKSYDPVIYKPKINQVGYFTKGRKVAVIPSASAKKFSIINTTGDTVFSGNCSSSSVWAHSEETVVKADFSRLETEGIYTLLVNGLEPSIDFSISDSVTNTLLPASIKAFYYNRASVPVEPAFGGSWNRPPGHPDNKVLIHASAATANRPAGTEISSPKGWYDAGDYNKYVVPSAIAVWQLLASEQNFGEETKDLNLNIPESNNTIPDIADEALWEIEWLKTMQDPDDGGVYHKLTNTAFDAFIMPDKATAPRYAVKKSTPAALNFASVLARSALYFQDYRSLGPGFSSGCISQAESAWEWAVSHSQEQYDQADINLRYDPDIFTGDYGFQSYNINWTDEWLWAAVELYLATGKQKYLDKIVFPASRAEVPTWSSVEILGIITILRNPDKFPAYIAVQARNRLLELAGILREEYLHSAYEISMGAFPGDFSWNSNGNALNQSMILIEAYELTGNKDFLDAARSNIDYVLGRNPLSYCFVTGFGKKSPQNIHHRISSADGIKDPVPGLLVNGPHNTSLTDCFYPSTIPAFTYLDSECSSATNEPAIYLYSSLVYALSGSKHYNTEQVSGLKKKDISETVNIRPNPNKGSFEVKFPFVKTGSAWKLINEQGIIKAEGKLDNKITSYSLENLPGGLYLFVISQQGEQFFQRILVLK